MWGLPKICIIFFFPLSVFSCPSLKTLVVLIIIYIIHIKRFECGQKWRQLSIIYLTMKKIVLVFVMKVVNPFQCKS